MKDCPHKYLVRQSPSMFPSPNLPNTFLYKCMKCGQKFKAEEWDGKVKVTKKAQ